MGGVRRIARQSLSSANIPVLTDNWTTQETTTYVPATPAVGAGAWGGTVANLDRALTNVGSTHTALGALLTFVQKPDTFAGALVKVQVTFPIGSAVALELWTLDGAVWTKRRRVPVAGLVRSGETFILDLATPSLNLAPATVDAMWITLAPDVGGETLTWTILHVYGICNDDPVTPDCPPGTLPEECDGPECGVDIETWLCLDPPAEPTPGGVPPEPDPPPTPPTFVLPPIPVRIPFPPSRGGCSSSQPPFNILRMTFGELPSGGSVKVNVQTGNGVLFAEGTQQTIAAPGDMDWTVSSGFFFTLWPGPVFFTRNAWGPPNNPALYPRVEQGPMVFTFTRQLDGSAFAVAGNMLDILTYFWTYGFASTAIC